MGIVLAAAAAGGAGCFLACLVVYAVAVSVASGLWHAFSMPLLWVSIAVTVAVSSSAAKQARETAAGAAAAGGGASER